MVASVQGCEGNAPVSGRTWTWSFLAATVGVLLMEVWASFDTSDATIPWTDLIVMHIPGEVTAALIGALVGWLPVHFGLRYWRKAKGLPIDGKPRKERS